MFNFRSLTGRIDVRIAAVALAAALLAAVVWLPGFVRSVSAVHAYANAPRELRWSLDLPPEHRVAEHWRFVDADGVSNVVYRVEGLRGSATVAEPAARRLDVPELYDVIVAAGVWAIAPSASGEGVLRIETRAAGDRKTRVLRFSPEDLANRREFHLDLAHDDAAGALAQVKLSAADRRPHLGKVISAIRDFGSPEFRAACEAARRRVE